MAVVGPEDRDKLLVGVHQAAAYLHVGVPHRVGYAFGIYRWAVAAWG